ALEVPLCPVVELGAFEEVLRRECVVRLDELLRALRRKQRHLLRRRTRKRDDTRRRTVAVRGSRRRLKIERQLAALLRSQRAKHGPERPPALQFGRNLTDDVQVAEGKPSGQRTNEADLRENPDLIVAQAWIHAPQVAR